MSSHLCVFSSAGAHVAQTASVPTANVVHIRHGTLISCRYDGCTDVCVFSFKTAVSVCRQRSVDRGYQSSTRVNSDPRAYVYFSIM